MSINNLFSCKFDKYNVIVSNVIKKKYPDELIMGYAWETINKKYIHLNMFFLSNRNHIKCVLSANVK